MPYFEDANEVYGFIGRLLDELASDPDLAPRLLTADTIVRFEYSDPEAEITIKLVEGEEAQVDCGSSELEPEVTLTASGDLAHRFWLGKVNPTVALGRGEMKAKGPVAKVLRLVPLLAPAFPRYEQLLRDAGREDLLAAARSR